MRHGHIAEATVKALSEPARDMHCVRYMKNIDSGSEDQADATTMKPERDQTVACSRCAGGCQRVRTRAASLASSAARPEGSAQRDRSGEIGVDTTALLRAPERRVRYPSSSRSCECCGSARARALLAERAPPCIHRRETRAAHSRISGRLRRRARSELQRPDERAAPARSGTEQQQ